MGPEHIAVRFLMLQYVHSQVATSSSYIISVLQVQSRPVYRHGKVKF